MYNWPGALSGQSLHRDWRHVKPSSYGISISTRNFFIFEGFWFPVAELSILLKFRIWLLWRATVRSTRQDASMTCAQYKISPVSQDIKLTTIRESSHPRLDHTQFLSKLNSHEIKRKQQSTTRETKTRARRVSELLNSHTEPICAGEQREKERLIWTSTRALHMYLVKIQL